MTRKSELKRLGDLIEGYKQKIVEYENLYQKIEGQTELELKDIVRKYENGEFKNLTIEKEGEYTYILGGDGRSSAWDEKRKGIVFKMEIPDNFFVSSESINKFAYYIKATEEAIQAIFINEKQIYPK